MTEIKINKVNEVHLSRAMISDILAKDVVDRYKKPNLIELNSENYNERNFYNKIISSDVPVTKFYWCRDSRYVFNSIESLVGKIPDDVKMILKLGNIMLAGGALLANLKYVKNGGWRSNKDDFDYDLFFYGLTIDQANEKINKIKSLISEINKDVIIYNKKIKLYDFIYNERSLTITKHGKKYIQIIFRLYKTKSEILHGFDLSISQIGFDGTSVLTTRLGYFALTHRLNIFDHTRRSISYEFRLRKYQHHKNIIICFPDCRSAMNINLPGISLKYKGKNTYNLISSQNVNKKQHYTEIIGDYEASNHATFNKLILSIHNTKMLMSDKFHFLYYHENSISFNLNCGYEILTRFKNIKRSISTENYSIDYYSYDLTRFAYFCEKSKMFENVVEMIDKMLFKDFDEIEKLIRDKIDIYAIKVLSKIKEFYHNNEINHICSDKKNIVTISRKLPVINWIVKNPGSQLTGSFEPIWESAEKWYGSYYSPMPRNFTQENLFLLLLANKFDKKSLIGWLPKDVLHLIFMCF